MKTTFTIIDEQPDFIIVDKPSGYSFHDEDDLGDGFFNQVKKQLEFDALYPVHRLDKMTSGLIIFAKTKSAAQEFQQLFEQQAIEKYYIALSDKKPKKKQGLIKGDMEKSRRSAWKLLRTFDNPAISQFFSYSVKISTSEADHSNIRLFVIKPRTGRTHQIRVALNSIGSPIIGDTTYSPSSSGDRGYLHAYALSFTLNTQNYHYQLMPSNGALFNTSEVQSAITKLGKPSALSWPAIK